MYKTPIHVLLVEDSPTDASLICRIFSLSERDGAQLIQVDKLEDAIDLCQDVPFDVVLLDLGLPDSDGLDTVIEFHQAEPDIPIVVLTGSNDEELALQALSQGAQDYLVKDQITSQLLIRAIRYAIERGELFKQLKDSERRFRGIFDQTFEFMALLTPDGTIVEINQTALELSGTKPEDFVGLLLWESKGWNCSPKTQECLKIAIADAAIGQFFRSEFEVSDAFDRRVWIDFSLKPLTDEKGKAILLIAEGRDISDRKRAEAEILKNLEKERELNQLKTSFISMVSHEFRTPLTAIAIYAEMLQTYSNNFNEDTKTQLSEQIHNAIDNMVQLLDEILLISRNEAGKLEYQPVILNLENFCRELVENFQLSNSHHQIIFSCQGECTSVEMDEVLLQHIFSNLLSNSIKYSPTGGNIWFDLNCDNGWVTFRVIDQGIGIPLPDQKHLFQTFQRGSNVASIQGTGLGLTIVKNCVDLHGGKIQIESQVGRGTIVTVMLPLMPSREIEPQIKLPN